MSHRKANACVNFVVQMCERGMKLDNWVFEPPSRLRVLLDVDRGLPSDESVFSVVAAGTNVDDADVILDGG